jgi:hypothetical protein
MILGIVGSRRRSTIKDRKLIKDLVIKLKPDKLVSGGCKKGADRFAEDISDDLNIPIKIFYPDCPKNCPKYIWIKAAFARNKQIAEYCNKLIAVVASDRTGGTEDTIEHFLKCNKEENLILL